jgi:ubiquinone biosynthesis protein UbiJ
VIAGLVNRALARALERSTRAQELCAALEGRRLAVTVEGMGAAFEITAAGGRVEVGHAGDAPADVTLRGSPTALLSMAFGDARTVVERGQASLAGDEALAQQFQELARFLKPDLEDSLGGFVGRIPAHLAADALRAFTGWTRAAGESLTRNGADYLAHETRDLVPRAEAEQYLGGVEELSARVATAERRLAGLAARLESPPNP